MDSHVRPSARSPAVESVGPFGADQVPVMIEQKVVEPQMSADDSLGCRIISFHSQGAREIACIPLIFRSKSALICGF
jgi:hypothetical protein